MRGMRSHADAIETAVLATPGLTDRALRESILVGAAAACGLAAPVDHPADLAPLLDKMWRNAHKVVDRDIEALRVAGYADDALFEVVVCAAAGAGLARLRRGLELMD
jgi:alkylhydroperoxidase family enzyme